MCHATTSVQTYSWRPELRIPFANFEVDNVCVDWDYYQDWISQHAIDNYAPNVLIHPMYGPSFPSGREGIKNPHHRHEEAVGVESRR
jgi:hypothetical protein